MRWTVVHPLRATAQRRLTPAWNHPHCSYHLSRTLSSSSNASPSPSPPPSPDQQSAPSWQYQRPLLSTPPSPRAVLSTYRALLRLVSRTAAGAQQQWTDDRSLLPGAPASPRVSPSTHRRALAWRQRLSSAYRSAQSETSPGVIAALHVDAEEYCALLRASLQHSREVFDAGWGKRQETRAHVANTARRVGLQVGDSTLDKEVRAELKEERRQRGEKEAAPGGDGFAERLEAVELRRKKGNDSRDAR